MGQRVSESVKVGPFTLFVKRYSRSLLSKGNYRAGIGTRVGRRGWASVSEPVGRRKRNW
jgi:hypothetical protein